MARRGLTVDRERPAAEVVREAAEILRSGGLVAFATETVYGLGADARRPAAVARIFSAKGRPSTNPLIVHVSDEAMARACAAVWPASAHRLAQALWPGPITLVVPVRPGVIAPAVHPGRNTIGLRVPVPPVARALIEAAGLPVAAPSANRSEHVSPTTAAHVIDDLGDSVDCVLDSGPTSVGIESTVVELVSDRARLLRPGPVSREALERILGAPVDEGAPTDAGPAASPGQHARHYAPQTPCVRVASLEELRAVATAQDAVLVIGDHFGAHDAFPSALHLTEPGDAARRLYAVLRDLDRCGARRIVILPPPASEHWDALRDRLHRAAVPHAS